MSIIIERALEKQKLKKKTGQHEMTAGQLLDALYEAIDSGKVHPRARVIFNNELWALFTCSRCAFMNKKDYNSLILEYEVHLGNSKYDTLEIFIRRRKK